jgi:uncharacterized protein YgiM (DUF1202 family)
MRLMPHIVCFGMLLSATAMADAKPAYVATTVNLRAAPGTTSDVVAKIPGGSLIDANNCTEGWCAVTWQEKSGFAKESTLDMSGRVPQRAAAAQSVRRPPPQQVYADDDYVVESPPVYYGPPPPYYYGYGGPYYRGGWGWRHRW